MTVTDVIDEVQDTELCLQPVLAVAVVTLAAVELFATISDRSFTVAAPHTWNKLPETP